MRRIRTTALQYWSKILAFLKYIFNRLQSIKALESIQANSLKSGCGSKIPFRGLYFAGDVKPVQFDPNRAEFRFAPIFTSLRSTSNLNSSEWTSNITEPRAASTQPISFSFKDLCRAATDNTVSVILVLRKFGRPQLYRQKSAFSKRSECAWKHEKSQKRQKTFPVRSYSQNHSSVKTWKQFVANANWSLIRTR